jgi:hypothetical protein
MSTGNDNHTVFVVACLTSLFVYANIAQYSVDKAGGECCFARVIDLASEVRGEPYGNV